MGLSAHLVTKLALHQAPAQAMATSSPVISLNFILTFVGSRRVRKSSWGGMIASKKSLEVSLQY
jgi:hypothetical protein